MGKGFNKLTRIPGAELAKLTNLEKLYTTRNQLRALPLEIGHLAALKELRVSGNKLAALPPEIGRLTALKQLYAHSNQLTALPLEIGRLGALELLRADGNPVVDSWPEPVRRTVNDNKGPWGSDDAAAASGKAQCTAVVPYLRSLSAPAPAALPAPSPDFCPPAALVPSVASSATAMPAAAAEPAPTVPPAPATPARPGRPASRHALRSPASPATQVAPAPGPADASPSAPAAAAAHHQQDHGPAPQQAPGQPSPAGDPATLPASPAAQQPQVPKKAPPRLPSASAVPAPSRPQPAAQRPKQAPKPAPPRAPPGGDVRSWSEDDVVAWVRSRGQIAEFAGAFRYTNGVGLLALGDSELEQMGVSHFGARHRLLAEIAALRGGQPAAAPDNGPTLLAPTSRPQRPLPPGYEYHVFITYRRFHGKNYLASLVHDALDHAGYKVFLDVRTLQGGVFDSKILQSIRASCVDVFILVDGTLERCKELDDWVRREIAEACHLGKAIIPVVDDPQQRFPSTAGLPPDMANFPRHNALFWVSNMQEECVARLCRHIDAAVANVKPFASLPAPLPPPAPAAEKKNSCSVQ
eukprot:tig00000600_g2281.t1